MESGARSPLHPDTEEDAVHGDDRLQVMKHIDWIIVLAMLAIGSSIIAIVLTAPALHG